MPSKTLRTTIPTDDGGSRFVQEEIPYTRDTTYGQKTDERPIDGFYLRRVTNPKANSKLTDYHQAPEDQYVIQLKGGGIEVGSTEGQKEVITPVSIGRVRDITGRGHSSVPLSDEERISLFVPIPSQKETR